MVEHSPQQELDKKLNGLKELAMDIYSLPPEKNSAAQSDRDYGVKAIIGLIADQFLVQHELYTRGVSARTRLLFHEQWRTPFWTQARLISMGPL